MTIIEVVEGWTGPLDFTLKGDGVAVDLTGCTVLLQLWDLADAAITLAGTTAIVSAVLGQVRFSPAAADLTKARSPIKGRFKVTDGAGKITYFPNGDADRWVVFQP